MFIVNYYDNGVKKLESAANVLWEIRNDNLEMIKTIVTDGEIYYSPEDFELDFGDRKEVI